MKAKEEMSHSRNQTASVFNPHSHNMSTIRPSEANSFVQP
jgi:hypothetical protein